MNVKHKGSGTAVPHHAFSPQGTEQPLPFLLFVELKFRRIPIAIKGGNNLLDCTGQILCCYLHVPLQTAGNGCIGQIGGTDIGRCKAGIPVKHVGLSMEPGAFGIVADFDFRIGKFAQLLDCLDIRCTHIRRGDNTELSAILGKLPQLVHYQPKPAPLDEGHQHFDLVS